MEVKRYAYIDALRGYAILLVIAVHASQYFSDLPYQFLANQARTRRSALLRRQRDHALYVMECSPRRRREFLYSPVLSNRADVLSGACFLSLASRLCCE